jgi:transcriptional regulator EpsA
LVFQKVSHLKNARPNPGQFPSLPKALPPLPSLSIEDAERLSRVIQSSLSVAQPVQYLLWLQGEVQHFIPHQVLIVGRGNFLTGELRYDVVVLPGVVTRPFSPRETTPFLRQLYKRWVAGGRAPLVATSSPTGGLTNGEGTFAEDIPTGMTQVRTLLAHGSKDDRRRRDCLCVALHAQSDVAVGPTAALEILFPHIDNVLRRVSRPDKRRHRPSALSLEPPPGANLSPRELEILEWVGKGKTNQEIALILDISPYTVKNHLQHIFRKLDVLNRAQAVGKFAGEGAGLLTRFSHG